MMKTEKESQNSETMESRKDRSHIEIQAKNWAHSGGVINKIGNERDC